MNSVQDRAWRAALLAVLLAAFAVRLWNIEALSIWGDEAFSIFTAKQDIGYVMGGGADTHPPLYHFSLHYWMELTGRTPFALRMLSALWSLLCVAGGYALARYAGGNGRVALLSAALIAVSPFQIFYAQETRMYAQAAALCALSLVLFLRWMQSPERGALAAWVLATLAALYTHYFAFFVLAAQDLYLLATLWRERRLAVRAARYRLTVILFAHGVMALGYLPWVSAQRDYLSRQANARAATLSLQGAWEVVSRSLSALFAGTTLDSWTQAGAALFCVILAVVGWRAVDEAHRDLPLLAVLAPIAGAIAVNPLLPFFRERFLLIGSVPFIALMAAGVWRLPRIARGSVLLALAGISVLALGNYWYDARSHKGEYGQAVAAIRAGAAPGDAVIRYAPIQDAVWDYYRVEGMPAYVLPGADLAAVAMAHPRAWLLLYGDPAVFDPQRSAEAFLGTIGFRAFYQGYRDGALARYDFPSANVPLTSVRVRFGDAIVLVGFAAPGVVTRGETLPVTLEWQASMKPAEDYTVFVHLLAADGKPLAQMDTQPAGGARPTRTWAPGETIRDRVGVAVPAGVPPERYRLTVGMYLLRTLERLPVRDTGVLTAPDNALIIGEVEVH